MKKGKRFMVQNMYKRIMPVVASFCLVATLLPLTPRETKAEETVASLMTNYQPAVNEVISSSDFKHPGIGLTKEILENMRAQVRAEKEPWISYFNEMLLSSTADRNVTSSNQSSEDPTKPASDTFNSQGIQSRFIADGLKAYTQSILYFVTGDEIYRANAMHIIRIWSQMDPNKYAYYNDAHIHSGIPLFRMVSAAEILRYTSTENPDLEWTDTDTEAFTNNLITPVIETLQYDNNYFMNQHLYPLLGAMSGYIFTDNRERYNEGVEWFTVNKTAIDQGKNGSIKRLFRLVETDIVTGEKLETPRVQIAEMGRDQAHSAGDVTNVEYLARLLDAQGTKVDPETGTPSTAEDAVNVYNFLDNRLLEGADYFARFMLGYETPWTPLAAYMDPEGNPTVIYHVLSDNYRGRIGGNVYGSYYYYKYTEGLDMEQVAPYFTEMFKKRHPFHWESPDGGGDYWLYIPEEAEAEGADLLPKSSPNPDFTEVELRYTSLDDNSRTVKEGDISFVEVDASEEGSRVAVIASATASKSIGFRIRTDEPAELSFNLGMEDRIILPDTKGKWKYVTYNLNNFQHFGDMVYLTIKGKQATKVHIDHIHTLAGNQLTPPQFTTDNSPLRLFGYVGADTTIEYVFTATDSNEADVIHFQMDGKPERAQFNEETGVFSWQPDTSGEYHAVVSASDGTSLSAKEVIITVTEDRESAIQAVIEPYDENTNYIGMTLQQFNKAHQDALQAVATASDTEFYQKLINLNVAVTNLEKLTPLLEDGSIDYTNMFVSTTFGNELMNLIDGKSDSFAGYYLADNLSYYLDFGPSFRVSADSFQLQVRTGFPERIGGVAVFGSDDKENWTRLTPRTTVVSSDMQTIEVAEDLQDQQYRFLKIQMIDPTGGNPMIELSEMRIFGERHEVINKISSVSISSEQSKQNRIVPGDTVKLAFTSIEPIKDVSVTIQGEPASIFTEDNLNWTAEAVMGANSPEGIVQFRLNYKTMEGVNGAETLFTTDGSLLRLSDDRNLLHYIIESTVITDSSGRAPDDAKNTAKALFDNDLGTITDYRVNGSGSGGWVAFDFQEGGYAQLSKVEVIARQDGYFGRIGGAVIQGSNDYETWETISEPASATMDWQLLPITSDEQYRYIRIYNRNNWFGNMSEVRFHGEAQVEHFVPIEHVSIQSNNPDDPSIALPGDTITLSFTTDRTLENPRVRLGDVELEIETEDNRNWLAQYTVDQNHYTEGKIHFVIESENGPAVEHTSDSSTVLIIDPVDIALEKAENLDPDNYARLAFYQYSKQVGVVKENLDNPEYSNTTLAKVLFDAKSLLVTNAFSHYSFDGNAESSDALLNGAISGTPVFLEGKIGEAIELNGSDNFITLPETHPLASYDEITIATWVKWNGGNQWQRIFDFGNNTNQYLFLTPRSGNNTLRFAIKNDGGELMVETSQLPTGEWVHVAITLGDDIATLFVNGEEAASANDFTIKPSDIAPQIIYIGKSMWPDPLFNGMLDEFSIFNYAMSAEDIHSVYENTFEKIDTSLLDYLVLEANKLLHQGDYTEESKANLVDAIAEAEQLNEGDVTQESVDSAAATIEAAMNNLEERVPVSFDYLSELTESYVTNQGVANALVRKLQNAKASAEKGNKQAMLGQLNAYENQVNAQSGKSISEENVNKLIGFLNELRNQV